jgi:hypothetical protein
LGSIGCGVCSTLVGTIGMDWMDCIADYSSGGNYCTLFNQGEMKQWRVTYKFKGPSEWQLGYMVMFGYDSSHIRDKFPLWEGLIIKIEEI